MPDDSMTAVPRRSYLFVPGNRPDRYAKACATRAHAVIVDLEDAVPPDAKAEARAALADWLPRAPRKVLVRVNAADTEWFDGDLRACDAQNVEGLLLPKVENADHVERVATELPDRTLHPLIESALGLWNALPIARARGVTSLLFGSLDFQADLGILDDELIHARSTLVLVSRVAGIEAPIDGVTPSIDDASRVARDAARGRSLGFGAKSCIHPSQIDIVNACFAPSSDDVDWARRVVAASAQSKGNAVQVDGRMVDRPVVLKARAILAEYARPPRQ